MGALLPTSGNAEAVSVGQNCSPVNVDSAVAYGARSHDGDKMTDSPAQHPVEGRLADRLSSPGGDATTARMRLVTLLRRLDGYDRAVYQSVAQLHLPLLDEPLRLVSDFANYSKPWILISGLLALFGGSQGRRAALTGLAAIGATSLVVNQPMKLAGARRRPDREVGGVPQQRWVRMPSSTSFPSGHSASAAAFAVAVGDALPALRLPLRAAAAIVAFSRVYTGVHYPGDVLVGATVGSLIGRLIARVARRVCRPSTGAVDTLALRRRAGPDVCL
jgi:membrane-associated phospholipid phosphatase